MPLKSDDIGMIMDALRSSRKDVLLRALEVTRSNRLKRFGLKRRLKKLTEHAQPEIAYHAASALADLYPRAGHRGMRAMVLHESRFGDENGPGEIARGNALLHPDDFLKALTLPPAGIEHQRLLEYWREVILECEKAAVSFLASLLGNEQDSVRLFALRALASMGGEAAHAAEVVRERMAQWSDGAALQAHLTLARLEPAYATDGALKIVEFLRSPSRETRLQAVHALSQVKGHFDQVVPELGRVLDLDREDSRIKTAVETCFEAMGAELLEPAARAGVDKPWADNAVAAVARTGPTLIPKCMELAEAVGKAEFEIVARVLGIILDEHPDEMQPVLEARGRGLALALTALQGVRPDRKGDFLDRLLELAGAENADTRREALLALSGRKGEAVVTKLIQGLEDEAPHVREAAAEALTSCGREARKATRPLIKLLKDESPHVRGSAARALAAVSPEAETFFPDLMAAFNRVDPPEDAERNAETEFLNHMAEKLTRSDPRMVESTLKKVLELGHRGLSLLPRIGLCLRNEDIWVRSRALELLRHYGDLAAELYPDVCAMVGDPDWYVRQLVMQCLPLLKACDETVALLANALEDHSEDVRKEAVRGLGSLGPVAVAAAPRLIAAQARADEALGDEINKALLRINAEGEKDEQGEANRTVDVAVQARAK